MNHARLIFVSLTLVALVAGCGGDGDGARTGGGATATVAAPARPAIGIGEQQAAMFSDKRFGDLGLDHARLVASYDTTSVRFERDLVDLWLAEARRAGVEPFVTFGHSRVTPKRLPSAAEFRKAFRAFRARYPDVKVYAPWNEINHASQPTSKAPARAAQFYNVVRDECPDCTVLAGDLLDQKGMTSYLARYRRELEGEPTIWGLHNYADANRFRATGLQELLDAVPGDVWLTETGGIVRFGSNFPRDEQRAARAIAYTLKLAREHERVKRVYLYNWTGAKPSDRFDSGLIAPDGTARPGYDALREAIGR